MAGEAVVSVREGDQVWDTRARLTVEYRPKAFLAVQYGAGIVAAGALYYYGKFASGAPWGQCPVKLPSGQVVKILC
jgi:hypothetical protein